MGKGQDPLPSWQVLVLQGTHLLVPSQHRCKGQMSNCHRGAQLQRQTWSLVKQVTCPTFYSNGTETGKASCVVMGCQCWLIKPPHFLLLTLEPRITGAGPASAAAPTLSPPTNASPLGFS